MKLLHEFRSAWGWVGIEPVELIDDNDFGNLILKDVHDFEAEQQWGVDWYFTDYDGIPCRNDLRPKNQWTSMVSAP